jgi:hypothetical protein
MLFLPGLMIGCPSEIMIGCPSEIFDVVMRAWKV